MAHEKQASSRETGSTRPTLGRASAHVYPRAVEGLIVELGQLPGIGRRTAERLAMHLLRDGAGASERLARALGEMRATVRTCATCWNLSDGEACVVCADERRDAGLVLVVEQPRDLIAIEQTGAYRGVYHVLTGRISPLEGVGPQDLTIGSLLERVRDAKANARGERVREVILGLNPTLEGDGTTLYLQEALSGLGVVVTRLARGLSSGGSIEHAGKQALSDALEGRG